MIVTRQRKKKQSSLPILLPIAAIAMLAIALTWPPSRNFITNGPLKPVATVFDGVWGVVSRPLSFAYQQQQITDRNQQIKDLNDKLETDRKAPDAKDAQVAQLQKQIAAINAQPEAATPAPGRAAQRPAGGRRPAAAPRAPRPPAHGVGCGPPRRPAVVGDGPRKGRRPRPKAADRLRFGRFCRRCRPTRSARSWMRCRPRWPP